MTRERRSGGGPSGARRGLLPAVIGVLILIAVLVLAFILAQPDDADSVEVTGAEAEAAADSERSIARRADAPDAASGPARTRAPAAVSSPAPAVEEPAPAAAPAAAAHPFDVSVTVTALVGGAPVIGVPIELSDGQTGLTEQNGFVVFQVAVLAPEQELVVRALPEGRAARETRLVLSAPAIVRIELDRRERPLDLTLRLVDEPANVVQRARVGIDYAEPGRIPRLTIHDVTFQDGEAHVAIDYDAFTVWVSTPAFETWRSERLEAPQDSDEATMLVRLQRGGEIFGHVSNDPGARERGVRVTLSAVADTSAAASAPERFHAFLVQRGRNQLLDQSRDLTVALQPVAFRFGGLASGSFIVQVQDPAGNLLLPQQIVEVARGDVTGPIDFVLSPGRAVSAAARLRGRFLPVKIRLLPKEDASVPDERRFYDLQRNPSFAGEAISDAATARDVPPGLYTLRLETPPVPAWASTIAPELAKALAEILAVVEATAAGRSVWPLEIADDVDPPPLEIAVDGLVASWTSRSLTDEPDHVFMKREIDRRFVTMLGAIPEELKERSRRATLPQLVFLRELIEICEQKDLEALLLFVAEHP